MLGEEHMPLGIASPKGETAPVAEGGQKPPRHKRLPVVRVEDDVPNHPLAPDIRHPPVVADPVADALLVLAHVLGTRPDVLAVARQDDVGERRLAAELVHDFRRLAPVRVNEAAFDLHLRPVIPREHP